MTATTAEQAAAERVPPRLKDLYRSEIAPALREEFGYANVMQVPGLAKIVV
ncbi:MAG TPA: 50S ribosomal protein L5, partial [Streptosporangiaceae bacterium]